MIGNFIAFFLTAILLARTPLPNVIARTISLSSAPRNDMIVEVGSRCKNAFDIANGIIIKWKDTTVIENCFTVGI